MDEKFESCNSFSGVGQAPHLGMSLSVVSLFPRRNVKFNIICNRVDGYALLYKATKVLCQITKKMGKELS